MAKVLKCKDVGIDCAFEAQGKTIDEVLKQAAAHARKEHGVKRVTQDYLKSWKKLIKTV
jgi:predicted small metal-binding protein